MAQKVQNLIVGAGVSGASLARALAEAGQPCAVIDKRPHLAGNCYDYRDENGIFIHRYGPHIFRTDDEDLWRFMNRFAAWHPYVHKVRARVDGKEVPVPFNLNSLDALFPAPQAALLARKLTQTYGANARVPVLTLRKSADADLRELGAFVYDKIFLHYTVKQWGVAPDRLDPDVTGRVPVLVSRDDRYFREKYQGVAQDGYADMVSRMLEHPLISVRLNADYAAVKGDYVFDRLFYSGPMDEYFSCRLGVLPYRSLRFEFKMFEAPFKQAAAVLNHPNEFAYTRSTEFKHFLPVNSPRTVLGYEYPSAFEPGVNERYYPVPAPESEALLKQYQDLAAREKNVFFFGRLGAYRYYDMQSAVRAALKLARATLAG